MNYKVTLRDGLQVFINGNDYEDLLAMARGRGTYFTFKNENQKEITLFCSKIVMIEEDYES